MVESYLQLSLWLDLKHLGATCLSLSSFVKKNGVKLVSRSGSRISRGREWCCDVRSRRAPSEANGPQGQQGHAKIHSGYIWTCGCPPARLSLKSSCLFRNDAEEAATSGLFQFHKVCLFMWLFAPSVWSLLGSCSKAVKTPTFKCSDTVCLSQILRYISHAWRATAPWISPSQLGLVQEAFVFFKKKN